VQLQELRERLPAFCRDKYPGVTFTVGDVVKMPGHAGFAYGFEVELENRVERWFLRLPPPNVRWVGTADVLRQVAVLNAIGDTAIPHCRVRWSGDDLEWFGRPYFVVPWLSGDTLRLNEGAWGSRLDEATLHDLGRRMMAALAELHQVDPARAGYLGAPVALVDDVTRWDRFFERAAEPDRLKEVPTVRRKLLDRLPQNARVGLFHGDFQTGNMFCSPAGDLIAVIDWELTGIGATLNDVGWIATFSDRAAWAQATSEGPGSRPFFLDPDTLIHLYTQACGALPADINWFRALAAYKFAIITGFNLGLHRRGKREDPLWEEIGRSMTTLVDRANELLG
jgi:aminoglycoside phosphotransferase (APT) family kinase protein